MKIRWFDYLNNKQHDNLLLQHKIEDNNLIVCQQLKYRKFALFANFLEFKRYQDDTIEEENCFYEVILSGKNRKIYFDIDIEDFEDFEEKEFLNDFFEAIKKLIPKIQLKGSINVYTSHTVTKKSYHIIVEGYYLNDEGETLVFFNQCKNLVKEKFHKILDASIYKKVQQFRILSSHKYSKKNIKIFREDLSYNYELPARYLDNQKGKENFLLSQSLISNIIDEEYLSDFKVKEEKIKTFEPGFSCSGDLEDVLKIFYSVFSESDFSYLNVLETNGNLIITFRRLQASFCQECKRYHEHENPYVTVTGIERNIYYYCRRREHGGKYLGSLGQFKLPDINIGDVKDLSKISEVEPDTPGDSISNLEEYNYSRTKKKKVAANFNNIDLKLF